MAKIGEGSLAAAGRQGLRELRGAFYPQSNIAQPAELGMYGTQTPGEIAEARRDNTLDMEQEQPSVLTQSLERAADRSLEKEQREPEIDR